METIHLEEKNLGYMINKASRFGERFILHTDEGYADVVPLEDLEALEQTGGGLYGTHDNS